VLPSLPPRPLSDSGGGRDLVVAKQSHRRHFVELLKEKGNALKLAWKADLIIDGAGGIWTQCNDLKGQQRFTTPSVYHRCWRGLFHRQSIPLLPRLLPHRMLAFEGAHRSFETCSPAPDTDRRSYSYIFIQKVRATQRWVWSNRCTSRFIKILLSNTPGSEMPYQLERLLYL
jgi:hypothetical protein